MRHLLYFGLSLSYNVRAEFGPVYMHVRVCFYVAEQRPEKLCCYCKDIFAAMTLMVAKTIYRTMELKIKVKFNCPVLQ